MVRQYFTEKTTWLQTSISNQLKTKNMTIKEYFSRTGFVTLPDMVVEDELETLRGIYSDFLHGKYDLDGFRSDLTGDISSDKKVEKITQIMRPSLIDSRLPETTTYSKALDTARELLGDDIEMDFDMMINKAPGTYAETPWHQDAAYWPDLPDKRAVSFWMALDDADTQNGCMMYIAGSHILPIQPHFQPVSGGALQCRIDEKAEISYGKLKAGSAIAHHGYTLHAALGNSSADRNHRALILNFRPKAMIDLMRSRGYDHLGNRETKTKPGK